MPALLDLAGRGEEVVVMAVIDPVAEVLGLDFSPRVANLADPSPRLLPIPIGLASLTLQITLAPWVDRIRRRGLGC